MSKAEMCLYDEVVKVVIDKGKAKTKIRVRCPICKRRIMVGLRSDGDGDWYYRIPVHKKKEWYKKKVKAKSKAKKCQKKQWYKGPVSR